MADQEHKHGEMDISAQQDMFARFINVTVWGVGIIVAALILLYLVNG